MSENEVVEELRRYLQAELLEGNAVQIDATTPLVESWILDSLNILKLVAHIEETYAVALPAVAINLQNFNTLAAVAQLVAQHRK